VPVEGVRLRGAAERAPTEARRPAAMYGSSAVRSASAFSMLRSIS